VIAGAYVLVTNTETNAARRNNTNDAGYFEISLLNPGMYVVTVEAPGFKKSVRSGLELSVAGRLDLALQREIGLAAETVEVKAGAR
jgi:hypothetical protein